MANLLDGGWEQPTPEDYMIVELKVSESLAREAMDSGALARLMGDDAVRAIKKLLEQKDLEQAEAELQEAAKRLEELETVEHRAAALLEAERLHSEGKGFHPGFPRPEEPQDG